MVDEGRSFTIEGDATHPANGGLLCERSDALARQETLEGRLLHPVVEGKRQRWDKAIAHGAQRLSAILARHGPGSIALHVGGGLLTEDYYVANKMMKGFCGSAHIHAPALAGAAGVRRAAFGEDVAPGAIEDVGLARLILIVGDAIAHRHPVLIDRVRAARAAGAAVILLGGDAAVLGQAVDGHMPVAPGREARLIGGLLHHAIDTGLADGGMLVRGDGGVAALRVRLGPGHDLWSVARDCGVPPSDLRAFYERWAAIPACVTLHPDDAVDTAALVMALHLATGRIAKPGAGPIAMPVLANAMGGREVGCVADDLAAHRGFTTQGLADLERFWGARSLAQAPGLDGDALLDALKDGRVRALWSIGDADSAQDWLAQARASGAFTIRSSHTEKDQGTGWNLLLPAPVWVEKDGAVTGMDRLVSRHRRLVDLPADVRPDWWAITRMAQAMGWGDAFHYERPADIYREHARLTAYRNDGARLLDLRRHAPISNPAYDELTPWRWGDVPFDGGRFPTPDGQPRIVLPGDQPDAAIP